MAEDAMAKATSRNPSLASSAELHTELQPELLRGVSVDVCLSGFGKHFARPDVGMFKVDHKLYSLSRQVKRYHAFLSHDWTTSRSLKLMSLLVLYNSGAAFLSSLLVSLCVGLLRAAGILPNSLWTTLPVYAVFPTVLCCWQRVRAFLFLPPNIVFFDKLCIAQHDENLKRSGILGLAGFLDHADQLTILWSHRYFSRVWCTYEISTFLRDSEHPKPILVMPVKLAAVLVIFSTALHLVHVGFSTLHYIRTTYGLTLASLSTSSVEPTAMNELLDLMEQNALYLPFLGPVQPLLYYIGIGMMQDLVALPNQLRHFRVQDADCFCCSNNHINPVTGEAIACDRQLVFKMLKRWYGKEGDPKGKRLYLERFNELVQEKLAYRVLKSMGNDLLPWKYSIYMVTACNLPALTSLIPDLAAGKSELQGVLPQVIWSLRVLTDWSMDTLISLFWIRISMRIWLWAVGYPACSRSRVKQAFLLTIPAGLFLTLMICSHVICLVISEDDSILPLIPFLFWLVALRCLWFRPSEVGLTSQAPRRQDSQEWESQCESERSAAQNDLEDNVSSFSF